MIMSDDILEDEEVINQAERVLDKSLAIGNYDNMVKVRAIFRISRDFIEKKIEKFCEENYSELTRWKKSKEIKEVARVGDIY